MVGGKRIDNYHHISFVTKRGSVVPGSHSGEGSAMPSRLVLG